MEQIIQEPSVIYNNSDLIHKDDNEVFTVNDFDILNYENKHPEPNWKFIFLEWMPESAQQLYLENLHKIYPTSSLMFIKGMQFEFGINTQINYYNAMSHYLLGASMNNNYCLFRLFYIYTKSIYASTFNINIDYDLGIFYLIRSAAYNENVMDLNKIDPIVKLMQIVHYHDKDLSRVDKLLTKMTENSYFDISIGERKYLYHFLKLNFCHYHSDFLNSIRKLEGIVSENGHMEACYKLACIYYYPVHKEILEKDIDKSLHYFEILRKNNYWKSYCSYLKICEEMKLNEKTNLLVKMLKEIKLFSLQFYANYLSKYKNNIEENANEILEYFTFSFLYGNLISAVICFEIISQIFLKNKAKITPIIETYLQILYDFVSDNKIIDWIYKLIDYDIVILFFQIHSYFYYKGVIVAEDLYKSIKILESTFKHKKSFKNYRKVFYYLGKCYKKIGDTKRSTFYFKKTFDIYLLIKEYPYHHYIVGKMFLRGIEGYLNPDLIKAFYFFKLGAEYSENCYFINSLYSKKCENFLNSSPLKENFEKNCLSKPLDIILSHYIDESSICIICCSNFRQIIFTKCGHKSICFLCFEKIIQKNTDTKKCPYCNTESKTVINDFNIEYLSLN